MELRTKEYRFNNGERKVEYVIPPTNTPFLSILFNKEGAVEMITVHQRVLEFHEAVMLMSLLCGVIRNESEEGRWKEGVENCGCEGVCGR